MDERNRPLAALSRSQVHSLGLRHRSVLVMMYNTSNQLFLQQRSPKKQSYPGCWDLSATGHVQLGESTQEAALRELAEELGVYTRRLYLVQEVPAGPQTGYEFVYLYSAGRLAQAPSPNPKEIQNWAFVHQNELDVMAESFAHLMTPGLLHFWRQGVLFS
ncbi:MAG: NUDIX hydrolase [Desulfohalobiaceae bacterium]